MQADVAGLPAQDRNNLIYVPSDAAMLPARGRPELPKDEIDGIYLQIAPDADIP